MRPSNERFRGKLIEGRQASSQEIDELKAKIQDMELDIDVLKETNEMFYGCCWQDVTIEAFIHQMEKYMVWYRDERIKMSLGGLNPMEYRKRMGIAA